MSRNKINILEVIPNLSVNGGVQQYVYEICNNLDKNKFNIDIVSHNWNSGNYSENNTLEQDFLKLGCSVFKIVDPNKGLFKFRNDLRKFFLNHNYDVIHVHSISTASLFLYYAKKKGISVRIFQSHGTRFAENFFNNLRNIPIVRHSIMLATDLFAVSKKSGKVFFGNKAFTVCYPGIEYKQFLYNENWRNKWRNKLNIDDSTFLIGAVGRLCKVKNPKLLIRLLRNLIKQNLNVKLVFCGEGPLERKIKMLTKKLSLNDHVIFLNNIRETNEIYSALDCFLMPSLHEGLPVAAIEAQISGLKCFLSEKITNEVSLGNASFLSIKNIDLWTNELKKIINSGFDRIEIKNNKFESKMNISLIERQYLYLLKSIKNKDK